MNPFGQAARAAVLDCGASTQTPEDSGEHLVPESWPPRTGYDKVASVSGWLVHNDRSQEWLYKRAAGVYFHIPTETLWKRAPDGSDEFRRVGQVEGLAFSTLGVCYAGSVGLLKACFCAWHSRSIRFNDMDHDIREVCQEARMSAAPRTSAPCTAQRLREDQPEGEGERMKAQPLFARFLELVGTRSLAVGAPLETPTSRQCSGDTPRLSEPLTRSSLARHHLRKSHDTPARDAQLQSLHCVFREREDLWRCHRPGAYGEVIDELCQLRKGTGVIFDVESVGFIVKALTELDEYILEDRGGRTILTEDGHDRVFRGDDLNLGITACPLDIADV